MRVSKTEETSAFADKIILIKKYSKTKEEKLIYHVERLNHHKSLDFSHRRIPRTRNRDQKAMSHLLQHPPAKHSYMRYVKVGKGMWDRGESSGNLKSLMQPNNLLSLWPWHNPNYWFSEVRLSKTKKVQKSIFKTSFSLVSLNITKSIRSFISDALSIAVPSWRGKSGPNTSSIKKCKYPKSASLNLQYLKGAVLDAAIPCYLLKNSAEDMKLLNTVLLYLRIWKY